MMMIRNNATHLIDSSLILGSELASIKDDIQVSSKATPPCTISLGQFVMLRVSRRSASATSSCITLHERRPFRSRWGRERQGHRDTRGDQEDQGESIETGLSQVS